MGSLLATFSVLILVFLFVGTGNAVMITEFCPDPYLHDDADEYIVLSGQGLLDPVIISDGEGGFRFPPGARIDGRLVIARNGPAYCQTHGTLPDFEWTDHSSIVCDVISGDNLRLANSRDVLFVYEGGQQIQNISWPGMVRAREGQVHYLSEGVWDPRTLMIGQSRFSRAEFSGVSLTTFVSPDASGAAIITAVRDASQEILLNVYEFSSPALSEELIDAHQRNVSVVILLEGGPVGGISAEENAAIWRVNQSGIPVYAMAPAKGEHAPYRYDHAKYLIIDRHTVLVTSENFKYSGFPPPGKRGNRGWGVIIEDPGLARYFARVFESDLRDRTVKPYHGKAGSSESEPSGTRQTDFPLQSFTGARVIPVIAPDTSGEITTMIDSAEESIEIEQAYITNETKTTLNPYLAAAINASRRGVRVRVLLDSYWYNTADPADNDEMAALINNIAEEEDLPLEARCADLSATELEKIHNKGVIVDDRQVLVSSINWNSNSPQFNREAGVIIDHPGAAQYFRQVFDDDWVSSRKTTESRNDVQKVCMIICVLGLLLFIYYRRHLR